jgi:hypothetical protein
MQALVTVVQATAQGCPDNDTNAGGATVRAEIRGSFFNDGTGPGGSDLTGDIIARLEKRFDDFGRMRIRLQVLRCTDSTCNGQAPVGTSPQTFTTSWTFGQPHVLRLYWEKGSKAFIGQVLTPKGNTILEELMIFYDNPLLDDSTDPINPFKEIRVQVGNSNCTDGATLSAIQALFDNVGVVNAL